MDRVRLLAGALLIAAVMLNPACSTEQITAPEEPNSWGDTSPEQDLQGPAADWNTYLTERLSDRGLLDVKTPNQYTIALEFDPAGKKYSGRQTVQYINNENAPLEDLYFHIYPNAFRREDTTPYSLNSYAEGFQPGSITISMVKAGGREVQHSILGADGTVLEIPLAAPLLPGKRIEIYMEYEVVLPPASEKFGYGKNTFQIGNGYPVAAVYDSGGWNTEPYYSLGDPFYSDTGNYNVTIKAPKAFIIACSGTILSETVQGENKIWVIEAQRMRDFAWAASQHFVVQERVVDGILVRNYLLPNREEINNQAAELAYKAVEVFNKIFGRYPYEVLSVVTADATGMEYPGMVFVWKSGRVNDKSLESTIIHEIAHQWWYGAVGNNQVHEAWLDESFAIYAQKLYHDEVHGEQSGEDYYSEKIVYNYNQRRSGGQETELVLTAVSEFAGWNEYTAILHKGAMFLHELETICGKSQFYSIMNTYYERYKYSIATTRDFIDVCQEVSGLDLQELIDTWLFGQ